MRTCSEIIKRSCFSISKESLTILFFLFFMLINTTFFFFDSSIFLPSQISFAISLIMLIGIALLRKVQLKLALIPLFSYLLILNMSKCTDSSRYELFDALYFTGFIYIVFFAYLSSEDFGFVKRVFDKYINIFVIITIPSLLIFFMLIANVPMPYSLINLGGRVNLYRNYFNLAIFGDYDIWHIGSFTFTRFCGLFEEPGMLATYSGLLLVADIIAFPEKKMRKTLLVVFGVMAQSMAFIFFMLFISMHYLRYSSTFLKVKLTGLLFLITLVVPVEIKDVVESKFFSRFSIAESGGFVGDNRKELYQLQFNNYVNSATVLQLILGNGAKSNAIDDDAQYASYQQFIYESGFLGFCFIMAFSCYFMVYIPLARGKWHYLVLTIVPLLSLYQRPDVVSAYYLLICIVISGAISQKQCNITVCYK